MQMDRKIKLRNKRKKAVSFTNYPEHKSNANDEKEKETVSKESTTISCSKCEYQAQNKNDLDTHISAKHNNVAKQCQDCEFTSTINEK